VTLALLLSPPILTKSGKYYRMSTPANTKTDRFSHCLVFYNPVSTNAAARKQRIASLQHILENCTVEVIETQADGLEANRALLERYAEKLGPRTLLCIAGGDGTTNLLIEALIKSERLSEEQRSTPILPLWCGNANDLAHMLNGSTRTSLEHILTQGNVVSIHPLECSMTTRRGKTSMRIAACYAGFGATAFAALRLNQPSHRQSRLKTLPGGGFLQDVVTVASALLEAPAFTLKEANNKQLVYERTFANGSRMAKLVRLPVELTDEMFYINTLERNRLLWSVPHFIDLLFKRVSSKFLRNSAHFVLQQPSWAHFDGEPVLIP